MLLQSRRNNCYIQSKVMLIETVWYCLEYVYVLLGKKLKWNHLWNVKDVPCT